ncbi:hypothetical protein EOD10_10610 [Mesorhizobium sp. M7A.T.Ca.TU.009.01.3.2]|nr:hypothetical protein EOD10_10610 [Mesorhizobium sp. M7A.T.Ca.TU.009.01.3.2]
MIIPFSAKMEPDLIQTKSGLMGFLIDRLRESLPEVFVFESVFSDVDRMVAEVRVRDAYKPSFESNILLMRSISCEEGNSVRCGRALLEFYAMVHGVADKWKRPLPTTQLAHIALVALGAERSLAFNRIVDPTGNPSDVILVASEATFEEKYGARVSVIIEDPLRARADRARRGAK